MTILPDEEVIKNLTVARTSRPMMAADLILPFTVFSHMNYKVCNMGVDYSVIEIEHEKEEYYADPICRTYDNDFAERVYSFANDSGQKGNPAVAVGAATERS